MDNPGKPDDFVHLDGHSFGEQWQQHYTCFAGPPRAAWGLFARVNGRTNQCHLLMTFWTLQLSNGLSQFPMAIW